MSDTGDVTAPGTCRLLLESSPCSGSWNMAMDEVLLQGAVDRGLCSVRLYRWSEPTLSLGYFQKLEEVAPKSELAGLTMVRRLSGGGAILHHHEWTYSCSVPADHPIARSPSEIYRRVHRAAIAVLAEHGIASRLRGEVQPAGDPVFLCFARGDRNDVVSGGHKILGSAQRRRRGAVLQHGSLLMRASPRAPQFAGVLDLFPLSAEMQSRLPSELGRRIAAVFGEPQVGQRAGADEREQARDLQERRYLFPDFARPGRGVSSRQVLPTC